MKELIVLHSLDELITASAAHSSPLDSLPIEQKSLLLKQICIYLFCSHTWPLNVHSVGLNFHETKKQPLICITRLPIHYIQNAFWVPDFNLVQNHLDYCGLLGNEPANGSSLSHSVSLAFK